MQGFVVGTAKGSFVLVDREDNGNYKTTFEHGSKQSDGIRAIVSLADDSLAILMADGKLLRVNLALGKDKVTLRYKTCNSRSTSVLQGRCIPWQRQCFQGSYCTYRL